MHYKGKIQTRPFLKTKNRTRKKTQELENPFQNIAHRLYFCSQMYTNFLIFEGLDLKD